MFFETGSESRIQPAHAVSCPGSLLREDVLPELGMSVTDAAKQLGVTRPTISPVINEKAAVSAGMALKLEDWFDLLGYNGGRAEMWVRMQADYDLWQARQHRAA